MIFSRETLRHAIGPLVVALAICIAVYMWGEHRKVDIGLTMYPQLEMPGGANDALRSLSMTVYDAEGGVAAEFSVPATRGMLPNRQLSLRPGAYHMRGIAGFESGGTRIVEQDFVVPDGNASVDVYLR